MTSPFTPEEKDKHAGRDAPALREKWNDGILAANLLRLAKYHRSHCNGDCNISLALVGVLYRNLIGRPLTDDEEKTFV